MQAMGAALPELDGVEFHAESAPETRQRHLALLELLLQLEEFAFQHAARGNARRLLRHPARRSGCLSGDC